MENRTGPDDERVFDVAFELERRPLTPPQLRKSLLRHPWMSAKILLAIYWQALRLLLKRIPIFSHQAADGASRTAVGYTKDRRHEIP